MAVDPVHRAGVHKPTADHTQDSVPTSAVPMSGCPLPHPSDTTCTHSPAPMYCPWLAGRMFWCWCLKILDKEIKATYQWNGIAPYCRVVRWLPAWRWSASYRRINSCYRLPDYASKRVDLSIPIWARSGNVRGKGIDNCHSALLYLRIQ